MPDKDRDIQEKEWMEEEDDNLCDCGCPHQHDEDDCCQCDEPMEGEGDDLFVFSFRNEKDEEVYFALLDEFQHGEKEYWICQKVDVDQMEEPAFDEENDELYVFIKEEEDGETVLSELESEEELETVVEEWQKAIEAESEKEEEASEEE
ncbi:MAG TPA: DUF1292 domain-containing protein [Thermotogota bacterium]|jgi:hypothetical protein|nr:DUF1292 domain-containing protein [Thermotogota bacterium]NLH19859.1 DUF1292 domain-containing protein [Thermotogaceae bacterium]OQC29803.1 MAG: hypothetical protein BWX67_02113 [Thermotogota bacterium ADurb.Bin062]HNW47354.1 DUF1292 domain-containing protein [Thermotogota bacterium]HNY81336.1 DUF1292 domain-containing protein [Thermotogota bacterium]